MPSSPASPGRTTNFASPEKIDSSALTTSTWMVAAVSAICNPRWAVRYGLCVRFLQGLGLLERFLDRPDHVERLLGQGVTLAIHDHLEALDGVLERHVLARGAGEVLRHGERLRQEALDLARAGDRELVLGGELVHAEDGDDVTQLLVALQRGLNGAGSVVVVFADRVGVDLTRGGVERVHRRVDTE